LSGFFTITTGHVIFIKPLNIIDKYITIRVKRDYWRANISHKVHFQGYFMGKCQHSLQFGRRIKMKKQSYI